MNTNFGQATAKIYQFPLGGRSAIQARQNPSIDASMPRVNEVV